VKLSSKAIEAFALVDFIAMTHPCFITERIVSPDGARLARERLKQAEARLH
jgi:hypothetical protein